ncbi:acetyl-CoA synthetase-like protein [Setomelanomma holmii]|uniref:Acetyl-CoA synthetase-like protein n=1 Tax=Setomelanomma holmii TaxID=210430 RepID=A0A9P4HCL0_9PLEO|nr:acetyl-CoA synthetase-like protein [Setomelanomma holmii]
MEKRLQSIWAHVLNLPHVALDQPFLAVGGDSISAMQVVGQCRKEGIGLGVQEVLRSRSVSQLVEAVKQIEHISYDTVESFDEPFNLTPIQSLYFQRPNEGRGHFNQSFYLQVKQRTSADEFRAAVQQLVARHSMLRARFSKSTDFGWQQRLTNDISGSYRFRSREVTSKHEIDAMIEDSQHCLDLEQGPLFAADFFDFGKDQFAFLTAHHIVVDLVSWRLMLEELEEILRGGELLPPALPFQKWAELQVEHAETLESDKVLPPVSVPPLDFDYWGINREDNTYGNASHALFELDSDTSAAFLTDCHTAFKTEPVELLLAALIQSWSRVFVDRPIPAIFNEGHGREPWSSELDISRTVGWFTALSPILVKPSDDPIETVRKVKDFKRKIPGNGRPYFARRCLTEEGREQYQTHWPMEILFNYLGQYQQLERADALLQPLDTMAGEYRAAGGTSDFGHITPRWGLFEISAIVFKGHLKFAFTFNRHMKHQDLVQQWVSECRNTLSKTIRGLVIREPAPTLSDFPLLSLNEERFDAMLESLSASGITPSEIEDAYPCSNMQEGLLLSQNRDAGFYAAATLHELSVQQGCLDGELVANAWRRVVQRHPALRTVFLENFGIQEGLYSQVVLKRIEPNIVHRDCESADDAVAIIKSQRAISYSNGKCPNHRFTICATTDGQVLCSLDISHAIMDGHSMSLLASELRQACEGRLRGEGAPYSDYISWLNEQLRENSLEFWKSYLNGSDVCSFPILDDGKTLDKQLVSIRLDMDSFNMPDLQSFCNSNGITLSNIFHTAWALTLSCYVGSSDVTFGYLTSARDAEDIHRVQDMVGPMINTLVCRVNLTESSRCLLDVIQDVQRSFMEALPHRHIALAEVQHLLNLSGANLFNTALSYRRLPPDVPVEATSVNMREVAAIYDPTEYPVSINVEIGDTTVAVELDYWTDHLSAGQAANVASTFIQALENITYHAKRPVSALDFLSGQHWQQIQVWNVMPPTLNDCVHHKFASWVFSQPEQPAVRGYDKNYTYTELAAVTDRLAHHLVGLGVKPETFVPTCFDKSAYAVVAMLSVLKAGGAAVPLDAKHPTPALQTRLEDASATVVLTTAIRSEKFSGLIRNVIVVDDAFLNSLPTQSGPPNTGVEPHNPCFVIFTSGSTGRPKGVVLEHSAMVTSAEAHGSKLGFHPGSRVLQFASYTFDNSLEEMFTTLQRGACVCVPSEDQRVNDLPGAIAELDANFMDLTPTVAALISPKDVPTIKSMGLGAEPLTKALIETWRQHVRVFGQYGPSEASINSAWRDFTSGGEATNIGKAIGSVSWVINPDNRDRLMPIGCKGELLIEGPILSRGYLNDPEKTAAAFIQDPEWARTTGTSGRRFYCTGDLVQYTSEGEMIYMGRKDNQVKLNGQRIELGEIEHHLKLNLPSGAKSAVELVKFPESKALVGFICLDGDSPAPPAIAKMTEAVRIIAKKVEVALGEALPAYYVPAMFMPVINMPMTTSGKLDRKSLRQMAADIPESQMAAFRLAGNSGRAPSSHVERTLARLWAEVLKLIADTVGAEDSFFRLGGDSISAMRLVTASRKQGIVLNVANVFAYPKLVDMAATAVVLSAEDFMTEANAVAVPFELISSETKRSIIEFAVVECVVPQDIIEDIYPCTRLQEGLISLSTRDPGSYVAQPTYRLPSNIDVPRFKAAWNKVIANEAILRTRIIYNDEFGFLQVVVKEEPRWQSLAQLEDITEAQRQLPATPGGPLISYTIVGEGTTSPFFIWTAHHAVYDGWSWSTLFNQVESCYRDLSPDLPSSVPFSRFVKYLSTLKRDESNQFWLSHLENITAPQFPQLPSPDYKVQATSQLLHRIDMVRRPVMEVTVPSLIRAAWGLLLATYSGSDDVLWGETNSGREAPVADIESIVGPTLTTAPVRLQLNRELKVREYLQETQRHASTTLPYQFAGLQHIRKLSAETAVACDFQSFLGIVAGDNLQDVESDLWSMQSTGTLGTNFFSYALVFNCTVEKGSISVEVLYDNHVTETWYIERLMQQFDFFVNRFSSPEYLGCSLGDIELINLSDLAIINSWNKTPIPTINRCIHSVIAEDPTISRPDAIAIDAWDSGILSYRELDGRATRLAFRLISLGVKPQSFIPLCFDKSGWTIVAILAVLKAGAAFVPLDFEAPLLRLRELVGDVQAEWILCAPKYEQLCQSMGCNTLAVDRATTDGRDERIQSLPLVKPDSVAYAFYTSGSTGKPKGAVINHSCWVSSSAAFAPTWGISESSRVLQFASYIFDACLIEIFSTLMVGGTVCVPDQDSRTNDLVGVINKFNVNWATLTPSVVRMMQPSQVPALKTLVLVGEAMSQQDLLTWADCVMLGNGYGPTECSAISTSNVMTLKTKPNNLGKAVTSRGWVVSRNNQNILAPVGGVGELLLEGPAVGAGYLNDPEKTAKAFVSEMKWATGRIHPAARIYKTGDLVKYNEDGTMLYLGRKDSQTKVRGQRLELSEVEHHLMEDAAVQSAIASVPTAGPCAKRLVGVVSIKNTARFGASNEVLQLLPKDTATLSINAIRDHLCERLPSYMIPSLWVAITRFSLTPGGKMDRRRVVQWLEQMSSDTYREISTLGLEPPRDNANSTEKKLQHIFAKVLNLPSEDIRLSQSFLHLGGDSIAAMQVSSQCRSQGLAITVQELIRAKSITALAAIITESAKETPAPAATLEYNLPFDLSPIQRVFFETVGDAHNHFNQAELFRLSRNFEIEEIKAALTTLVAVHPMLRARFSKNALGVWQQKFEKDLTTSFRLQHHSVSASNDSTLKPIIDDSQATLNILAGPVFAVDVFNLDDTFSQAIAIVGHHLVVDVVSWGIILEDFEGLLSGSSPPPQSLPYHTWLQQQSAQAKRESASKVFPVGSVTPADLEYWGMETRSNISADVIEQDVALSTRDTMLLLGAQDALGTEILDILVAALLESFRKTFSDRPTVTIHNEGHGREPFQSKQDLTRTVGWFSTLSPIHLPVSLEDPTDLISTIRWVKDMRERTPGKGQPYFGYRQLTEAGKSRFASHWPAEVIFNYHGRLQHLDRKDTLLQPLEGVDSKEVGDEVPRLALFDITAAISHGAIKMSFGFNKHMKRQNEIRTWIAKCRQTLVDAVDQLLQVRPEPSLSDFKLLPLTYNGMSRLSAALPAGTAITEIEDIYPASPMQQGLLLTQMKHPELYMYHAILEVQCADTSQTVDPRRVAEAWQVVVHRHPALRTIFIDSLARDGSKNQVVFKNRPGRVQFLTDCDDIDAAKTLREQPGIDCREAMAPHRMTICKTNSGKIWVKLELSHAINDGTSITNILSDLSRAYERKLTRADTGPLYRDFIAHILSSSQDVDVAYWKNYLSGIEPCFFPSLNDGKSGSHIHESVEVNITDTTPIHEFCKRNGVTLSSFLQVAWGLVLHCYVGAHDVSFGVVASGRDVLVKNIEEAVGVFVNMLIARLTFSDDTTIAQLLETLQTDSVNALAHQACSLADVQNELQLPTLFNSAFTFQRRSLSRDPETTALLFQNMEAEDPGEYAITINADVSDDEISVDFGYWTDKVCPTQARGMADTFEKILLSVVSGDMKDSTVGKLGVFTSSSLRQIMEWNATPTPAIRRCVHEVIHEQALTRPRTTKAVDGHDGSFTYQEFDRITDQLAAHLQSVGVTAETFVPILFEKSSWAVVSMIAIMKAGGAYVPLDPKHPQTRLQELITDVGAKVVLCSQAYHARATKVAETPVVIDARAFRELRLPSSAKPKLIVTSDNAAYCLFTSGTTGKPKGTIIPHQAFCTSAAAFTRRMNINATSRTFQFASYTFDASCIEILSALTVGATVCVPSDEERMNNPAGAIRRLKATWSLLTPSVLGTIEPDRVSCLKTLVAGGEALPAPIVKKWGTSTCFINAYGPTECAVVAATCYKSTLDHELLETESSTIGTGSGARLWVVHPRNHDKLMPVGSVGELVIEGPTVARGYLNDEVKTAKAFIENPAWASAIASKHRGFTTARMYKSGDLVRYNSDGSVSYIGRKDTQIKLNGQRIELGEIEFHVGKNFPEHVQSAVELVAPSGRAKALAVFFAVVHNEPLESTETVQPVSTGLPAADELLIPMTNELRDMCKSTEHSLGGALPSYMIPAIFIPIRKMPWTSAGKLDRNRLRNLVQNLSREAMTPYRLTSMMNKKQPTTTTEKKLHKIVCSVLNLPASAVGIDDSFIRLGGNSVLAMRLVAAAQSERMNLSVIDIFTQPKLSDLAAKCNVSEAISAPEKTIQPFELLPQSVTRVQALEEIAQQCHVPQAQIQDVFPASPLQEALFTLSIKQPGAYVAQHILELAPSVDVSKLKSAWAKTTQEVDILRTRIVQLQSGQFLQAVLADAPISWRESGSLDDVVRDAKQVPEHIGASLTAYTIVRSAASQYLVWTIHHSLYDGWSIALMLQRVQQIYQNGQTDLPQTSYTRFIKYLANADVESSKIYWKRTLAGSSSYQFPQQSHSALNQSPVGQTLQHIMQYISQRSGDFTPSNAIRAAWALLLSAYTGSEDVVYGETLTGRDISVAGITDVCGPTLTTVPTRVQINRSAYVLDLLKTISAKVTDRIPHQHFGLSEIKNLGDDAAAACDFQNLLVVQTAGEDVAESTWSVYDNGSQSNFFTYPLVIECTMGQSNVEFFAHYHENVISTFEVQRLLFGFESVLKQLSTVKHVRDVRIFSDQDIELVRTWNATEPITIDDTVSALFMKQVARQPDAIAVSAHDGELTYSELLDLASRLAQELVKLGAEPERLIPTCLDKSKWAVVAIMGILISGAGYVPLSPTHPTSRRQQIITDCKATIVVCSPEYESRFAGVVPNVIGISEASVLSLPATQLNVPMRAKANNTCYVIYTSGSTGVPKGVVVEHRAIASSSAAICKGLHMKPTSRVFQFCSFLFDVSIGEILTPLTCGATICVPSEQQRTSDVAAAITALEADWAFLTPSVACLIDGPSSVPTLKTLVAGGEAMTSEAINRFAFGLQLCNGYGPTEGTVFAVTNGQVSTQKDAANIGVVTQSGRSWLTNPTNPNELAPLGATAELCLEGPFLARGYLNDAAKTAGSFIENPAFMRDFTKATTTRIYRTGDLVRYAPDGSIVYIGRKDNQVKLAGQRIELAEIEHHLLTDNNIQHAVVQLPKAGPGKGKLIAAISFATPATKSNIDDQPWRTLLTTPDVPLKITQVRERLTSNTIAGIGEGRPETGLGGDSITAMQLLAKCRAEGINLALNQVLRAKSLAHLARSIEPSLIIDYDYEDTDKPFALSPVQRLYFQTNSNENGSHFNQSYTARLSRNLSVNRLKQAFDAIVKCHSMLRARFTKDESGRWQQIVLGNTVNSYSFKTHTVADTVEVAHIISATQKSLDIQRGPVFAVDLITIRSGEQILFIAAHHLVIDVVSWKIILGDLEDMLTSVMTQKLAKEFPFHTWCEKQAAHVRHEQATTRMQDLAVQPVDLGFWGMEKRANFYGDVERDEFVIDQGTTAMALDSNGALRTDIVDLLIAAIIHSFSRIFINRNAPTVFNESHGREPWDSSNIDLSRTVGWFTTMYPITVPIGEDEDEVVHTIRQVKDLRRRITGNGRPYFAHRFLTEEDRSVCKNHSSMEVLFNYLGKTQQVDGGESLFQSMHFSEEKEEMTSDVGIKTTRLALFEVTASNIDGRIQMSFMYNRWMKNQKGIRRWIAECQRTLKEMITTLAEIKTPQPTMSDFPLLPLESYERLDRVLKTLPETGIATYDQVEDIYPCSAIQEGMLLSQIKDPGSYWSYTAFEAKSKGGPIESSKLAEAWQKVIDRHQALRTVILDSVCKGGVFDQVVVKHPGTGLVTYTCADADLTAKLASIQYRDLNGKKKPHLPHQAAIVQTSSGRIIVKIIVNHAVVDGDSLAVIGRDLEDAYEGCLSEDEGPLYSDYIKHLRSLDGKAAVDYWKNQLRAVKPCYFPPMPHQIGKQRRLGSLDMKYHRFAELHTLAEKCNFTFANILLAVWAIILRSYTGNPDICYGYLTSGRNVPVDNIENAVGAFINMLVSRAEIAPTATVLDVIQKVQDDFLESVPHQHCSLAQFQHDLGLGGKPLFNTAVSIQNSGATQGTTDTSTNIEFEQIDGHDASEYIITLNIDATRGDEAVRFAYWTDAVSEGEAKNVSSLMVKILNQLLANPDQTVAELDVAVTELPRPASRSLSPTPSTLFPTSLSSTSLRPRSRPRPQSSRSTSSLQIPRISTPRMASPTPAEAPDWSHLIRSIVSEMVPQIVEQIVAKNKTLPEASTIDQMTNQMTGMIARRASVSHRERPNLETGSMYSRGRRGSVTSNAECRIQTAADMVAAAGVLASESTKSPEFVEKKLLGLWSELLDMVEDTIEQDDSFFENLGGDSIIAMRLVGAAREEGLSMTVADVFKNPTFADMTRVVRVAGEVIDEVMSRAGDGSAIAKDKGDQSNPANRLPARAASLWDDFQSVISEYKGDDNSITGKTPPGEAEHARKDAFKKWQNLTTSPAPSRPQAFRRNSSRSMVPQTIQEGIESNANKSVSLLGDPSVDSVISKVQVFKGGIADVLPVTDFQSLAITGSLLESKWMLNYFFLEGDGPLDLRKLKQAAFRITQAFDILRTVFVPYGDRFLQVVLRKLQPDFIYQQTDDDLEIFTTDLRQRDREHGPRLGEAFTQFVVVKQKQTSRYRIFMRLSHAQYDGVCIGKILEALQNGYNGLPISSAPSFGNFVRESAKTVAGAHDHWRETLRGSKMTEIVNRFGPNYQRSAGRTITLERKLTTRTLSRMNITTATIVKGAWAATLARIAGKSDIVFGHVISGRNSSVANIENIVGPCLNTVPVRVVYRPEWTVHDLLSYIQDQQIANMPYESLGFREITRHCTEWPDWTNFSSVLQHDQNITSEKPTLQLGGIEFSLGAAGTQQDFADFSVNSTSRGGHQLDIALTYAPNSTITADYAEHVFEMLCANIKSFVEDPHALLPSPSELSSQSSTTINSEQVRKKSEQKAAVALPTDTGLSKHEVNTLATTLRSAWQQILHDEHGTGTNIELASDFFQLGGDIMGLAQVASILAEEGFKIRVEDLLDKSVFVEQVGLLVLERKKQVEKEEQSEKSPWGVKGKQKRTDTMKIDKRGGFGKLARKIGFGRKEIVKG